MLSYSLKTTKIKRGTQTFFTKESESEKDKHCWSGRAPWTFSCSRQLCESWLQKLFNKNNYPLVQFHCIIKIMCQDLPLGCLHCLLVCAVQDRNFGCSTRFYVFLLERQTVLKLFALSLHTIFFIFPNFGRMLGVPEVWWMFSTDYSIFDRIYFLMHSLLVLMKLSCFY